jgi:uncharacterized protein YdhG (YjbR/CyaY superfamily)
MKEYENELEKYDTAEATIHFSAVRPLPIALVKKLVKARIRENEIRVQRKGKSLQ